MAGFLNVGASCGRILNGRLGVFPGRHCLKKGAGPRGIARSRMAVFRHDASRWGAFGSSMSVSIALTRQFLDIGHSLGGISAQQPATGPKTPAFGLAPPVSREDLLTAGTRTPMRSRTRRGNPYGNRPGPLTAYRAVVAAARAQSTDGVQVTGWEEVASCVRRLTGTC